MQWNTSNVIAAIALACSLGVGSYNFIGENATNDQDVLSRLEFVEEAIIKSKDENLVGRFEAVEEIVYERTQVVKRFELLERDFDYEQKEMAEVKAGLQSQSNKVDTLQESIMEMRGDMKVTNRVLIDLTEAVKDLRLAVTDSNRTSE